MPRGKVTPYTRKRERERPPEEDLSDDADACQARPARCTKREKGKSAEGLQKGKVRMVKAGGSLLYGGEREHDDR